MVKYIDQVNSSGEYVKVSDRMLLEEEKKKKRAPRAAAEEVPSEASVFKSSAMPIATLHGAVNVRTRDGDQNPMETLTTQPNQPREIDTETFPPKKISRTASTLLPTLHGAVRVKSEDGNQTVAAEPTLFPVKEADKTPTFPVKESVASQEVLGELDMGFQQPERLTKPAVDHGSVPKTDEPDLFTELDLEEPIDVRSHKSNNSGQKPTYEWSSWLRNTWAADVEQLRRDVLVKGLAELDEADKDLGRRIDAMFADIGPQEKPKPAVRTDRTAASLSSQDNQQQISANQMQGIDWGRIIEEANKQQQKKAQPPGFSYDDIARFDELFERLWESGFYADLQPLTSHSLPWASRTEVHRPFSHVVSMEAWPQAAQRPQEKLPVPKNVQEMMGIEGYRKAVMPGLQQIRKEGIKEESKAKEAVKGLLKGIMQVATWPLEFLDQVINELVHLFILESWKQAETTQVSTGNAVKSGVETATASQPTADFSWAKKVIEEIDTYVAPTPAPISTPKPTQRTQPRVSPGILEWLLREFGQTESRTQEVNKAQSSQARREDQLKIKGNQPPRIAATEKLMSPPDWDKIDWTRIAGWLGSRTDMVPATRPIRETTEETNPFTSQPMLETDSSHPHAITQPVKEESRTIEGTANVISDTIDAQVKAKSTKTTALPKSSVTPTDAKSTPQKAKKPTMTILEAQQTHQEPLANAVN